MFFGSINACHFYVAGLYTLFKGARRRAQGGKKASGVGGKKKRICKAP
jgi:hypothetical protein